MVRYNNELDLSTPRDKNDNRHMLNAADKLSQMLRAILTPDNYYGIVVARKFIEHVYHRHDLLDYGISDRSSIL